MNRGNQNVALARLMANSRQHHLGGRLLQARQGYQEVVLANPQYAEAHAMLASIDYREGSIPSAERHLARAVEACRAAAERQPGNPGLRASLANLLLAQGANAGAEQELQNLSLPLNPIRADPEEFERRRQSRIDERMPSILISSLPKSASESIWNKLAQGLDYAQCYFSVGLFPDCTAIPGRVSEAGRGGVIVKEHLAPTAHNLRALAQADWDRVIVHLRDPRQATLSWLHFARDDINRRLMAPLWRKIVPPAAVLQGPLSEQIDWGLEHYMPLLLKFAQDWHAVEAMSSQVPSVLFLDFELFRRHPEAYFARVLDFCGIDRTCFADEVEAEVVHLRKGLIEEWRQVFTTRQAQRAWAMISGDLAERFAWQP